MDLGELHDGAGGGGCEIAVAARITSQIDEHYQASSNNELAGLGGRLEVSTIV